MEDLDSILIKRILEGDYKCFETLVSRYQKKVFSFIYRMAVPEEDARDLTQEVFIQIFKSLRSFRGESKFSTWVYRIAANKSLDFLRKSKKIKSTEIKDSFIISDLSEKCVRPENNPEQIILYEEKIRRLRRLIAGLPDRYKVVLVLFNYENMSYQQIAEALDIPLKTVATRLYRAKLILKEKLGGGIDEMP